MNPGLFYTILSRITTLGSTDDKMSSAIYFTGENMKPDRILNISKGVNNHEFKRVMLRNKWVRHLNQHIHTSGMSYAQKMNTITWSKSTIIDPELYKLMTGH
jgi:hypothetical protein